MKLPHSNAALIRMAKELCKSLLSVQDELEFDVQMESLHSVVEDLWESVAECSDNHHLILATIESILIGNKRVPRVPRAVLSEIQSALDALESAVIADSEVRLIRSRISDEGVLPCLPIADGIKKD